MTFEEVVFASMEALASLLWHPGELECSDEGETIPSSNPTAGTQPKIGDWDRGVKRTERYKRGSSARKLPLENLDF